MVMSLRISSINSSADRDFRCSRYRPNLSMISSRRLLLSTCCVMVLRREYGSELTAGLTYFSGTCCGLTSIVVLASYRLGNFAITMVKRSVSVGVVTEMHHLYLTTSRQYVRACKIMFSEGPDAMSHPLREE